MGTKKSFILPFFLILITVGFFGVASSDNTLPVVTINSVTTPTNIATQTITGTFTETNITITVNGVLATITGNTYSADVTLIEGSNTITATATDLADNIGTNTVSIFLDTVAPTLNSNFTEPTYPTTSDLVTIKASFNDEIGVDKAEVKWSFFTVEDKLERYSTPGYVEMIESEGIFSSPAPIPSPTIEGGFGEGYVEYRLRPYDLFGNHKSMGVTENPFYFTYDDTAPQTSINIPENEFITSETSIILTAIDPDLDGDGFYQPSEVNVIKYSVDGITFLDYGKSFNIEGNDGSHTITFFSVDNAGNVEEENTVTVTLDNTAPLTIDDYAFNDIWVNADQTIILTPNDDGSGLDWTRYCLTSGCNPFSGTDYITPVLISTEGITHFRYASADNVGNVETTHEKIVKIDKTNPVTTESGSVVGWTNQDVTVTLNCEDGTLSGCKETFYSTDGSPNPTILFISPFRLSDTGKYQLTYFSTDFAENTEDVITGTPVQIDKKIPTIKDNYANDGDWVNSPQTVTLTPSDTGGSGIASVLTCEGAANCTPNNPLGLLYELTFNVSQNTIVRYQAFDVAGNPSIIGEFNVKIDLENPSVTITSNSSTDKMDFFIVKADVNDEGGSELESVVLTLRNVTHTFIDDAPMTLVLNENYEYLLRMWDLVAGEYTLEVTATDNAGNVNVTTQTFKVRENVAPSRITSINNQVNATTGGTVSFKFDVVVRNDGEIIFGIDDVAGISPHFLNARISDGITNVSVGQGIGFIGAGILDLEDTDTDTPNVQGSFTLYLDIPKEVIPGDYPINYFIDVA